MAGLSQSNLVRRLNHTSAGVPIVQQPKSAILRVWSIATLFVCRAENNLARSAAAIAISICVSLRLAMSMRSMSGRRTRARQSVEAFVATVSRERLGGLRIAGADRFENRLRVQFEKLIDLGEGVRMRAAHETAADKTDVERAFRAHSRSSTRRTSCVRDVPRCRLRSRRGQHQSHHGSPSLNGGSLSAGTPCSAIASSMATPT
jgi:hypothetical protein